MSLRPLDQSAEPVAEPAVAAPTGRLGPLGATMRHLQDPMRRSSYALILGTGLTSGLGLLFWALAARWLPASAVGVGAALVASVTLLANFSTLGLRNGLVRFLPAAGSGARRLIGGGYALCAAAAVLTASVFLLGQPLWATELGFLRSSPLTAVIFVAAVVVWVIFVLQDHVLLATRRATWVPVANGLCSVAKIVLLPVLAGSAVWAIFAATVLPALAAVAVITALVLRRPAGAAGSIGPNEPVSLVRLVRFAATDHLSALLWLGTADILTLVILQQMGPEASAYYFIATMIGYSLYLITSNVGSALVAEGAHDPARTIVLARQAVVNAARLVIPAAILGALLARFVLGLIGASYADNATLLLQLILASAVPQIIVAVALSTARLRQDLRLIVVVYTAQAVGMLGGSWLLIGPWGLPGVGVACLATATGLALTLLVTGRTGLETGRETGQTGPRPLTSRLASSLLAAVLRLGAVRRRRRARAALRRHLPRALAACRLPAHTIGTLLTSDCDTVIVAIDEPRRILKIATSAAASTGLRRHTEAVARLTAFGPPADWHALLPQPVRQVSVDGLAVVVEDRLPGQPATGRGGELAVTAAAMAALTQVHAATADAHRVDAALRHDWVTEPLAQLRACPGLAHRSADLDRIEATLTGALADRRVRTASTHGDFWPGNTLITDGVAAPEVTGLVDWENARPVGLPDADLLHWWLSTEPGELGAVVRTVLLDPAAAEIRVAALPQLLVNHEIALEHLVLLTWLWHVSDGLRRASRNAVGRVWLHRNVEPVLALFRAGEGA